MSNFRIKALDADFCLRMRQPGAHDDYGHPIEKSTAREGGYGPCRCCLRQTRPGEERLLFSHAPVGSQNAYNEVGPVFIHAEACRPYAEVGVFPPEVKAGRMHIPLVLRAYSADGRMMAAESVPDNHQVESQIGKLFENPLIAFVHVRNAEAQCFICDIKRI